MIIKTMLITALLCHVAVMTQQSPLQQNYTTEILRLAKAAHMRAFLRESTTPCMNFYKFACGEWSKMYSAKANPPKTSYLQQLQELYVQKSAALLKQEEKTDNTADKMLKNFFKSCTAKPAKPTNAIESLLGVVNFGGGWPQVKQQTWYETEYDWLLVIAKLRQQLGVDILVGLDIVPSFAEADMHRIKIGAPQLSLGTKAMYLDDEHESERQNYTQAISKTLRKYFKEMPDNWYEEIAAQVLKIEQKLADGLPTNTKLTMEQQTRLRFAHELKAAYGNYVDLSRYLNIIFNQTILTQVYETPEDYMANLVEVIKQTPKLTIANYTVWRVLEHFERAADIEKPTTERACIEVVLKYYPQQMESLFQRNSNNMQMINELQSVWADIRRLFREDLQSSEQLNWMTSDTRNKAVQKLDLIDLDIEQHDDGYLQDQMFGINLRPDNYFHNLIRTIKWQEQHKLAKLLEKPQSAVADSDTYVPKYDLRTNKIRIPIVFLQPRFFWDPKYPHALKYSTLGILLAQEMLHAFDNYGRNYDKYGHPATNWWDTVSVNGFNERAKCFQQQYRAFKRTKVSAGKRLSTAIVDNGALSLAYRAYQKWYKNSVEREFATREILPHLNYTQNQLFFIGYAQLWCADHHDQISEMFQVPKVFKFFASGDDEMEDIFAMPEQLFDMVGADDESEESDVTDHHDADNSKHGQGELFERMRVTAALMNFDEFSRDFRCDRDENDNGDENKKCVLY